MRQQRSRSHDPRRHGREAGVGILVALAACAWNGAAAQPASSGGAIVNEVLKDAEQEQNRDSERVRRMVEEAVKGAERAPSGEEAVNPEAPDRLRPVIGEPPGALPAGFSAKDLENRPVRDGTGARIGTLRGVVLDEGSGIARVMVEFAPMFGQPGKISAMEIEALTPAPDAADGYVVELTPVAYEAMPAYAREREHWRRVGA
jgi:hypothetical protein